MVLLQVVSWLHLDSLKWLLWVMRRKIPLASRLSNTTLDSEHVFESWWDVSLVTRCARHFDLSKQALAPSEHPHPIVLSLPFFIISIVVLEFFNVHWILVFLVRISFSLIINLLLGCNNRILNHTLFFYICDWWRLRYVVDLGPSPVINLFQYETILVCYVIKSVLDRRLLLLWFIFIIKLWCLRKRTTIDVAKVDNLLVIIE